MPVSYFISQYSVVKIGKIWLVRGGERKHTRRHDRTTFLTSSSLFQKASHTSIPASLSIPGLRLKEHAVHCLFCLTASLAPASISKRTFPKMVPVKQTAKFLRHLQPTSMRPYFLKQPLPLSGFRHQNSFTRTVKQVLNLNNV